MARSTGCGCGCGGQKKGNGNGAGGSFKVTNIKEAQQPAGSESKEQKTGFTIAGFPWWAALLILSGIFLIMNQQG